MELVHLKEVNPGPTDLFLALSDSSQNNMVASLVARSLGIERTFVRVDDPDFVEVCHELGLTEKMVPSHITSQYLYDEILSESLLALFDFLKNNVSLYRKVVTEEDVGSPSRIEESSKIKVIYYFRNGEFHQLDAQTELQENDEIILLTGLEDNHRGLNWLG